MHYESDHPLVKHKLAIMRNINTGHKQFRELVSEITALIAYEATRHLETIETKVETPLAVTTGHMLKNEVVLVPILRAAVGMLEGMFTVMPNAHVGFVGMYRDHVSKEPVFYYEKFPLKLENPHFFVVDPMLATGGSMVATINLLKEKKCNSITSVSIISAPEGIKLVEEAHPDVAIYTGIIDESLDENKYIVPGLGDAGDRIFGTDH
ncbi:MAG: uracil phosphoribosyltransferase [bacterium]|nr:uracil phosphoribosyltransferase [bacterium]